MTTNQINDEHFSSNVALRHVEEVRRCGTSVTLFFISGRKVSSYMSDDRYSELLGAWEAVQDLTMT